jgi:transcriptional regulator with XRE-family HTH domain
MSGTDKLKKEVGERIRALMKARRLSVTELALQLGISRQNLYFILEGKQRIQQEMGIQLAQYFNVSMDELYGLSPLPDEIDFQVRVRVPQGYDKEKTDLAIKEWTKQLERYLKEEDK